MADEKGMGFRDRVKHLFRTYDALLVFLNNECPKGGDEVKRQRRRVESMFHTDAVPLEKELAKRIKDLRRRYEAKVSSECLIELADGIRQQIGNGKPAFFRKADLLALFGRYDLVMPHFEDLPEHARVDVGRPFGTARGQVNVFIMEVAAYEDMCALFNLARQFNAKAEDVQYRDRQTTKTLNALLRGASMAAFHFVEAYLNGLAFDHLVGHRDSLDGETRAILTERPRFVPLGKKLLEYPRIVAGVPHALLQGNNCPELAFFLERTKRMRDALAHPSPAPKKGSDWSWKEEEVFSPDLSKVEQIVDNSIRLVRKLHAAIFAETRHLIWLHDRGADGLFPTEAFGGMKPIAG